MRLRLTLIGSSCGLVLPREILELLGVDGGAEVDVQLAGNTQVVTPPDLDREDIEAGLAYLTSKREREEVYRRLAQ